MNEFVPPAGYEIMGPAAQGRARRAQAARAPRENVSSIGVPIHPLQGTQDGVIEPNTWEGQGVPPRHWIVKDLLPAGEVTMLTGNGGEGKSLLTMQLLIAAATGNYWIGRRVDQVRALGVYCEDDRDELHRRCFSIVASERINFSDLDCLSLVCRKNKDSAIFVGERNDSQGAFTAFFQRLRATTISLGAQLVVLDSLYDFFEGDENSKPQAKQFVDGLAELASAINGAVVIVAHPSLSGMGSGAGTAGSTAWHNRVRSRLYLHRRKPEPWVLDKDPDAQGDLILQPMKANYAPKEAAIKLVWETGRFVPVVDPHAAAPTAAEQQRSRFGDNDL